MPVRGVKMKLKIEKSSPVEKVSLSDKIVEFNTQQVPFLQEEPFIDLSQSLKTEDNLFVGGISAFLYCWKCLYIDVLWIDEKYRHFGYGEKLIKKVEEDAIKQGCHLAHLDTFDFQAKDFYLKQGYDVFGELDDCPSGHKRFYLRKYLK